MSALHDRARLDHLVVMAGTLAEGAAWCEATLGVLPGAGGEHPLFGTHNRLLSVASDVFPLAYLEIIAINPEAAGARQTSAGGLKRWFDMDDEALRAQLRRHGPRLIHWVARVPDVQDAAARQGADPDVVFVIADGLSSLAVARHAVPLLQATLPLLSGWSVGPVVLAEQARVVVYDPKVPADEIRRHEQDHQAIVEQYAALCFDLMQRKTVERSEALEMVEHWIVGHVVHHDLRLRDYLTGQPPDRVGLSMR